MADEKSFEYTYLGKDSGLQCGLALDADPDPGSCLACSRTYGLFVLGLADGLLCVPTEAVRNALRGKEAASVRDLDGVALTPCGKVLALALAAGELHVAAAVDSTVLLYHLPDLAAGNTQGRKYDAGGTVLGLWFNPDPASTLLLVVLRDGGLRLLDAATAAETARLDVPTAGGWTHDGRQVVYGTASGTVHVAGLDLQGPSTLYEYASNAAVVCAQGVGADAYLVFSMDGEGGVVTGKPGDTSMVDAMLPPPADIKDHIAFSVAAVKEWGLVLYGNNGDERPAHVLNTDGTWEPVDAAGTTFIQVGMIDKPDGTQVDTRVAGLALDYTHWDDPRDHSGAELPPAPSVYVLSTAHVLYCFQFKMLQGLPELALTHPQPLPAPRPSAGPSSPPASPPAAAPAPAVGFKLQLGAGQQASGGVGPFGGTGQMLGDGKGKAPFAPSMFGQQQAQPKPSVFAQQPAGEPRSAFGQPAAEAKSNIFGQQPVGEAKSAFGQPGGESKSAFGQPMGEAKSAFGQPAGEAKSSIFGQPAGEAKSAFGQPTGEAKSAFGQAAGEAKSSIFGQQPTGEAKSAFGQGNQSPFGSLGQATAPKPLSFGSSAGGPAQAFGQAPAMSVGVFGQPQAEAKPSPFGQHPAGEAKPSPFGQQPPGTAAAGFGARLVQAVSGVGAGKACPAGQISDAAGPKAADSQAAANAAANSLGFGVAPAKTPTEAKGPVGVFGGTGQALAPASSGQAKREAPGLGPATQPTPLQLPGLAKPQPSGPGLGQAGAPMQQQAQQRAPTDQAPQRPAQGGAISHKQTLGQLEANCLAELAAAQQAMKAALGLELGKDGGLAGLRGQVEGACKATGGCDDRLAGLQAKQAELAAAVARQDDGMVGLRHDHLQLATRMDMRQHSVPKHHRRMDPELVVERDKQRAALQGALLGMQQLQRQLAGLQGQAADGAQLRGAYLLAAADRDLSSKATLVGQYQARIERLVLDLDQLARSVDTMTLQQPSSTQTPGRLPPGSAHRYSRDRMHRLQAHIEATATPRQSVPASPAVVRKLPEATPSHAAVRSIVSSGPANPAARAPAPTPTMPLSCSPPAGPPGGLFASQPAQPPKAPAPAPTPTGAPPSKPAGSMPFGLSGTPGGDGAGPKAGPLLSFGPAASQGPADSMFAQQTAQPATSQGPAGSMFAQQTAQPATSQGPAGSMFAQQTAQPAAKPSAGLAFAPLPTPATARPPATAQGPGLSFGPVSSGPSKPPGPSFGHGQPTAGATKTAAPATFNPPPAGGVAAKQSPLSFGALKGSAPAGALSLGGDVAAKASAGQAGASDSVSEASDNGLDGLDDDLVQLATVAAPPKPKATAPAAAPSQAAPAGPAATAPFGGGLFKPQPPAAASAPTPSPAPASQAPAAPTGIFAKPPATATTAPATGSLFKAVHAAATQAPAFGAPSATQQAQPATGAFGAPSTQPATGAFGAPSTQPATGAFGAPSTQPATGAFGAPSTQPATGAFGGQQAPATQQPQATAAGAFGGNMNRMGLGSSTPINDATKNPFGGGTVTSTAPAPRDQSAGLIQPSRLGALSGAGQGSTGGGFASGFGATPAKPAFGATAAQPAFGSTGLATAAQPAFGASGLKPTTPSQPAFGSTGLGAAAPAQPAFGASGLGATAPGFAAPAFGSSAGFGGGGSFGAAPASQGSQPATAAGGRLFGGGQASGFGSFAAAAGTGGGFGQAAQQQGGFGQATPQQGSFGGGGAFGGAAATPGSGSVPSFSKGRY